MTDKKEKPNRYRNLKPPWKPGQSANPRGRPPRDEQQRELLSRISDHGDEALDTLIQVMRKTRAGPAGEIRLKNRREADAELGRLRPPAHRRRRWNPY